MRIDAAVIERLVNHRGVAWHDARGHKAKRRSRILVEAREIDRRVDAIRLRIDDADGVRVFVGDEDAVKRLDAALLLRLRFAHTGGGRSRARGGELEKIAAV